ncbi:MAG: ATP-binding protein [Chloroflexota bacterium]
MLIIQRAIAPPTFEDEQQSRLAVLLHQLTLGLAGLALLFTLLSLLFFYHPSDLIFGYAVIIFCVAMNILGRKGYTRTASVGLVVSLWVIFTLATFLGGGAGVFDASYTGYIIPIAVAGYLVSGRAGFIVAVLSVISGAFFVVLKANTGDSPFPLLRSAGQWIGQSVLFLAAAYSLSLTRKNLMAALHRLQTEERALSKLNSDLQRSIEERARAENAFRTRYERLLRAFHAAGLETWTWDVHKDETTYPDTDPEISTYFPKTMAAFYANVHPDDLETVKQTMNKAIAAGEEYEVVYRYNNQDNKEWYYTQATPDFDADGKVVSYVGASFDITHRRIAEEGLHASEAAARAFQEKLKALHEVSIQLAQTSTLDELYRQAVELALTKLGFDRLGLFLLSETPNEVVGTYGTDMQGNIRDEHELRFSLDDNILVMESLNSKLHVAVHRDANLWDNQVVVGSGWNAMAMLWNETSAIGWLAADNLVHHEPANDDQIELLSLFGSMLGPLILKKQAELETVRQQERLRLALQAGGMFTWTWNLRTNAIVIDDQQPYGISTANQTDAALAQIHPDDQHLVQQALERTTTEGFPYTVEYRILNNGVSRWVYALGQVYRDDAGKIIGIVGVSQDITERKQAEERFYKAFHANPSAIAITRFSDGLYIEVNDEWLRLSGYTREETIGHTSVEVNFWDKPEDRAEFLDIFNRQGYLREVERLMGGKDGRKMPVLMLVEKIELGDETCFLSMLQDISGRKEAEKQALELALQRERVALLTEFMSNVSHDIKTPLTAINTSLYLLERTDDAAKQREKVNAIRLQTQLLEKFIQDILTISRLDYSPTLDLQPVILDKLLHDIVFRLRASVENKNLSLTLELAPAAPPVLGDVDELSRVLVNLIENAVTYTPSGGSVQVRTLTGSDKLVVEVTDTGIGINPADMTNIFNRFYRAESARAAHNGGTGLGLAIVKKIVEMHNGSVEVISTVGEGSTFRIHLPLAENQSVSG